MLRKYPLKSDFELKGKRNVKINKRTKMNATEVYSGNLIPSEFWGLLNIHARGIGKRNFGKVFGERVG